jgi:hypothetical protein
LSKACTKRAKPAISLPDTALRDIQDLLNKGVLEKETAGGGEYRVWVEGELELEKINPGQRF